jgi:hypothetical protein
MNVLREWVPIGEKHGSWKIPLVEIADYKLQHLRIAAKTVIIVQDVCIHCMLTFVRVIEGAIA